ncbi:MAG: hydrogenase maturation protein HypF [Verrucomicrobiota bacterium]
MKTIPGRARTVAAPLSDRPTDPAKVERLKIAVRGAVQGVGFRPFVYRLAAELGLNGWVLNSGQGVLIEVEGLRNSLQIFLSRLGNEKPARAILQSLESSFLDAVGYTAFEIRDTNSRGAKTALILPDIATCEDCLREMLETANRRFRYPFTNCTNCGPRFSIIEALPYDRANTSMKKFVMCAECEQEYHDPLDRRFHAQPNACPRCGPQVQLWSETGAVLSERDDALSQAADAVRAGKVLALKGLGGFQLIVDARSEQAVKRLRERKHRVEKPFAVMFPSLDGIREVCVVSVLEERLLLSPERPIVLLSALRSSRSAIASSVAPGNPNLGVMLPYTPLHHLLLRDLDFPVVATSGNLSDEPMCIAEDEAIERLRGIADVFLVHNRPIVRHIDDSIARIICGRELLLRRARGYAPLPVTSPSAIRDPKSVTLAVGAHLKNTVALSIGQEMFVSQHIGDLGTEEAHSAFRKTISDLPHLYDVKPDMVVCDMHPDYLSTKYAAESGVPIRTVQHHAAHVAACMSENEIVAPALGVSWDGTGYGLDGTIWGGEFLLAHTSGLTRVAHMRQFKLPGGDAASREPRRSALGVLHEIFGNEIWEHRKLLQSFEDKDLALLRQMLTKMVNAPLTSSVGRLFDAIASLVGLRDRANFEGQAAMELEFALHSHVDEAYPFILQGDSPIVIDWQPAVFGVLSDMERGDPVGVISAKFHNMLVETIVAVARHIGERKIVLTGGCFQNRYLTERAVDRLLEEHFHPYWHQRIPPNDSGISLGQIVAASWAWENGFK